MQEKELIEQLKKGKESAYKSLFELYYPLLCKIANEFVHDRQIAETLVGDVVFSIWERREELDITTSLKAYLVRAVRNQSINYLQREYIRKEVNMSELPDYQVDAYYQQHSDYYPLGSLLERELEGKIEEAIDALPDECKRVFKLSRFEDKSYKEISDEVGISVNTVKYHIKNGIQLLNKKLGKYLLVLTTLLVNIFDLYL